MSVFVDTSAWYAAADRGDAHHSRAVERLSEFSGDLVTSDHVLVETWFLTANRLGVDVAETQITAIRSGMARVEVATIAELEVATQIHDAFSDQQFSIVDRTSWSIMQCLGVHEAVSFDRDYSIYRFGRNRRQAFTVHT